MNNFKTRLRTYYYILIMVHSTLKSRVELKWECTTLIITRHYTLDDQRPFGE